MARLTAAARKRLPRSKFALPGGRYPVEDRAHAIDAKARASEAVNAGRMSKATEKRVDAAANKEIGKRGGPKGHKRGCQCCVCKNRKRK